MSNYPTNMDDNETHDVLDEVENDLADEIALDVSMDQHEIEDINVESYICTSPTKQTNDDSVRRKAVKKPLTAFIFYMSEKREKLMKENPHLKFGEIGKMVGETYKLLAPEERARYDNLAKQDRERYIREFEEFKIYSASHPEEFTVINKVSDSTLTIPLGRVRRILKLDPDVKAISKEASIAITKATELFVAYLAVRSNSINIKRKTKSIRDIDLYQTIHATELLQFLRVDFPKTVVTNAQEKTAQQHANTAAVKAAEAPVGVASIKSFFQGKPQSVIAATASISTDQDDAGDDGEGTDGGEAMVY